MTPIEFDNSFARMSDDFFAKVSPAEVLNPSLIKVNDALALKLGLDADWLRSADGIAMIAGNRLPSTAEPIAMVYAGHQFGGWSPQLGDGRAMLIGELVGADGVRRDVQLKGSGPTPFSRQGDGRAPLGPVIREYLVSEAMAGLGIPTTRALAAVATGEIVHRETPQPGGILTRVAESHIRVGTFQFFGAQGRVDLLARLTDYVIDRHYPDARRSPNPPLSLFESIVNRQANLIARWMQVGFIHGVMNTDNMQIVGETIDFGPCAFMENYDADTVLSSIDRQGRYAWGNQPGIGQWNLTRLGEAMLPLLAEHQDEAIEAAKAALALFGTAFQARFLDGFREKMGFPLIGGANADAGAETRAEANQAFVDATFVMLKSQNVDFTLFFRHLTRVAAGQDSDAFLCLFDEASVGERWLVNWHKEIGEGGQPLSARVRRMRQVNPIFIPRNHRIEEAIQGALRGEYAPFERLNRVLARPFDEQSEESDLECPAAPDEVVRRTFCGT